jgi:RNA recognition motif-containing protein
MSTRLHIGNLPSSATEADLRSKFAQFGTVESAIVVTDAQTGRSKRFGIVEMANDAEARAAINRLNMTQYDEVIMSVSKIRVGT